MPFFVHTGSRSAIVAQPPAGVPAAAALAAAVSATLGSPLPLPLEPLLAADAAQLPGVAAALSPGGVADATGAPRPAGLITVHDLWAEPAGGLRLLQVGATLFPQQSC